MITTIIMLLILSFLGFILVYRDSKGKDSSFFDIQTSECMRGFWCLIVLLVHIPLEQQNTIQDAIGSFAFIGVTFFFMTSSYGLTLSALKKPESYLHGFWTKRLSRLMLPMLFVNVFTILAEVITIKEFDFWQLFRLTGWVRQILFFYLMFWLLHKFLPSKLDVKSKSLIVILVTCVFSLFVYITKGMGVFGWPTETMGFIYGILLALFKDKFQRFALNKWLIKTITALILSAVLGVAYLCFKTIPVIGDYILKIFLGAAILSLIFIANSKISIGNPVSRFLGSISYEIYLFHSVAFILLEAFSSQLESSVYVLLSMLITIVLSYVVNRLCSLIMKKR